MQGPAGTPSRRAGRAFCFRIQTRVGALVLCFASSAPGRGQGYLTITAGASQNVVVSPGATLAFPLLVSLSPPSDANLADVSMGLRWPAGLTLDSVQNAYFTSSLTRVTGTSAIVRFNRPGGASITATLATLHFTAATAGAGRVSIEPTGATDAAGASILERIRVHSIDVCVAPTTRWGDVNNDNRVDVIDAQQLARYSVALSVASRDHVEIDGDVNEDGAVNVIDAQQIARFSVGLSAATRISTPLLGVRPLQSVSFGPDPFDIGLGAHIHLDPHALDSINQSVAGCAAVAWSSSNPSAASVDGRGLLTTGALGSTTVTASVAGKTASAVVRVSNPATSITLAPDSVLTSPGNSFQLTAALRDVSGAPTGSLVTFSTSDSTVATVSSTGLVLPVAIGRAVITARTGSASARTIVIVPTAHHNALATGTDFTCILSAIGDVYCWGKGGFLGDGTSASSGAPVRVAAPPGVRFTRISAGGSTACAMAISLKVYCWGNLGDQSYTSPVEVVSNLSFTSIVTGDRFGCGLTSSGTAHCWGRGNAASLGTGDLSSSSTPRPVAGNHIFSSIHSGLVAVCGIEVAGAVFCWGSNITFTLGQPLNVSSAPVPLLVPGGPYASLAVGSLAVYGRTLTGTMKYWGTSYSGALGVGFPADNVLSRPVPTTTSSFDMFASLYPGTGNSTRAATCALTVERKAWCWGGNDHGQLGRNDVPADCPGAVPFSCSWTPVEVMSAARFLFLSSGGSHVCGLTTDHELLCWGSNVYGQLGTGTTTDSSFPVAVTGGIPIP